MIYHITQGESSHSPDAASGGTVAPMADRSKETEHFLRVLRETVEREAIPLATLSRAAGLNARAVTDLLEGRVQSPKLSTVFAIAKALGLDPGEMMGLGSRSKVRADLVAYLSQYSEEDQARILAGLRSLPTPRDDTR